MIKQDKDYLTKDGTMPCEHVHSEAWYKSGVYHINKLEKIKEPPDLINEYHNLKIIQRNQEKIYKLLIEIITKDKQFILE